MAIRFRGIEGLTLALLVAPLTAFNAAADPLDDLLGSSPQSPAAPAGVPAPQAQSGQSPPAGAPNAPASSAVVPPQNQAGASPPATPPAPNGAAAPATQAQQVGGAPVVVTESAGADTNSTGAKVPARVQNRVLEEIVVTAEKREESIQNVPIAIQGFNGDSLAARDIQSVQQLDQSVPSLHFTQAAGYELIYMRGIGTDEFVPSADPSIATYIDGIYTIQGQAATQSLGNVARVEVLKGPQGTLFGRDAIGGAINVVTEVPGNDFKASSELSYSSFDSRSAKIAASGPITSWLSASVSGSESLANSYITDTLYAVPAGKTRTGRVKLDFHPSDNFSVDLTVFHDDQLNANLAVGKNTTPSLLGTAVGIQSEPDNYIAQNDLPASSRAHTELYYGNVAWKLPWLDIKLLGSDQQIVINSYIYDFDGSPLPLVGFDTSNEFSHIQTGEVQFVSNDTTFLADKFKWVVGLFYYHGLGGFDPAHFRVAPNLIETGANLAGLTLPSGLTGLFNSLLPYSSLNLSGFSVALSGLLGTYSYSAYTQGTYSITSWLDLTLGGRYQYERRFLTVANTSVLNPANGQYIGLFNFPLGSSPAFNFSPKAELSIRPRDNMLIYGSYTVGYKSGTYNVVNIYTAPNYIVPEKVSTYELGAKMGFWDGQLQFNAALFDNQIRNLQTGFVSLLSGGAVQFNTAPAARSRGAEFDGTFLPVPDLDPGLVLTANAAYVEAKYTDYPAGEGFQSGTGIYSSSINLTHHEINNSPTFSGGAGVVQTIPAFGGSFEIAADEYFNGGFFYDANNTVREAPYATTAARVGYEYTPWGLRLTAFGENLLDRRYHLQQFQTDFGLLKTLAPPRSIGVRLNWAF